MSFQILAIVLYGNSGKTRVLVLRPGEVNVVVGDSRSGKSALIDIVDYCLGSEQCTVPAGVIRETVHWFGLKLQLPSAQVFVARQAPNARRSTSSEVYYEVGTEVEIPSYENLRGTTNPESLIGLLSRAAGIRENIHEPPEGQTRRPLAATLRHALFFCFQRQDEIINQRYLFHRQGDPYIPQTIKDILPYFLGAVDDDHVAKKGESRRLRDRLREYQRRLAEMEAIRGGGLSKALSLLAEAQDLGLLDPTRRPASWEEVTGILGELLRQPIQPESDPTVPGGVFEQLLEERSQLSEQYRKVKEELETARAFAVDERKFSREAGEQGARLKSIEIFGGAGDDQESPTCPLCQSALSNQLPTVDTIQASMNDVSRQLERITQSAPQIQKMIDTLEDKAADLKNRLSANRESLAAVQASNDRIARMRDDAVRRAHVLGRVSLYLESLPEVEDTSDLKEEIRKLQTSIAVLEEELSDEHTQERLDSILSLLGAKMTEWAKKLELEHSQFPLRLDLRRLNVVADTGDGPLALDQMGSGENWVGYHLIAHMALHDWFTRKRRPVPRFLFLDQPSEVYFPAEKDTEGKIDVLSDQDRRAVIRMFRFVFDVVNDLAPDFQVILTEHAEIVDNWFQNAVRARWRRGRKLVPTEWLSGKA